jgi:hypothetical protein
MVASLVRILDSCGRTESELGAPEGARPESYRKGRWATEPEQVKDVYSGKKHAGNVLLRVPYVRTKEDFGLRTMARYSLSVNPFMQCNRSCTSLGTLHRSWINQG